MKNWIEQIEDIVEKQIKEDSTQEGTYDKILDICDEIDVKILDLQKTKCSIRKST